MRPRTRRRVRKTRTRKVRRIPRSIGNVDTHTYKLRFVTGPHFASSVGVVAKAWPLMDITTFTEYGNLASIYDVYKIEKVTFDLIPCYNLNGATTSYSAYQPLYLAHDPDSIGSAFPVAANNSQFYLDYGNCKVKNMLRRNKITLRPSTTYDNSVDNSGMTVIQRGKSLWLDIEKSNYYQKNVLAWYSEGSSNNTKFFDCIQTTYVTCAVRR
jgi:hypothetical protein